MRADPRSRYTVLTGRFWVHYPDKPSQGPEPDGDTVRFEPDDPEILDRLPWFSGRPPALNARGNIAVRYEGNDALETHFKESHQNLALANAARDRNLELLGFEGVRFSDTNPNKIAAVDGNPAEGYVIANGIEANGRLLALVYTGQPGQPDGTKVFVDDAVLDASINVQLVREGLAYVEPYDTMPISLVRHARDIVRGARDTAAGVFGAEDVGVGRGAEILDLAALEELVMWPKLYRRLTSYFAEGHLGLAGFDAWIRRDRVHRDDTLRLPDGEKGNMHDAYRISGDRMELVFHPEDLLIAPDPSP
jgi:hypothetical protein